MVLVVLAVVLVLVAATCWSGLSLLLLHLVAVGATPCLLVLGRGCYCCCCCGCCCSWVGAAAPGLTLLLVAPTSFWVLDSTLRSSPPCYHRNRLLPWTAEVVAAAAVGSGAPLLVVVPVVQAAWRPGTPWCAW